MAGDVGTKRNAIDSWFFDVDWLPACAGAWMRSWEKRDHYKASWANCTNESTQICFQCGGKMLGVWGPNWASNFDQLDAWPYWWEWAPTGWMFLHRPKMIYILEPTKRNLLLQPCWISRNKYSCLNFLSFQSCYGGRRDAGVFCLRWSENILMPGVIVK